ncbi:DUF2141 domain-containing protein [Xanthomonas hortorum]|uniref:DUF2141 domain-containing protein n=1 Tax=Xanthomonas hortorum pv. pelargonii TaxID=453602 RepID=A0A6V7BCM6_9XANT|nr:DUF2141 domain-containing protein [Xanthomonas hortorum]MCE4355544.1 DUF2141 domain-containing protein [Xanthomonas hortorum pv. pelargonii]MCM5524498.1 DUF2141 domain-containing protein [Xanthomonas hortorum pv. pelargonii]MCM5537041.1 DUF2141 domain-containing protein [Xanthomonas hortorum pv. pelargonii]MCM5540626.1 DUF2141 domain-containing protein [Xanthomonas hortorum pv. pelargonii]MCM5546874.1 DUF2141 domain-containing protein [Xanthomonas hortorum pv. pelargonii]
MLARTYVVVALVGLLGSAGIQAADLDVGVSGLRSQQGKLRIAVIASAAQLESAQPPVQAQTVPITSATPHIQFKNLAPGRYAVMINHDENSNGKLDTNLIGMPVEGYGFSNNPTGMRKPSFDEIVFDLPAAGKRISVQMR